MNNYEEYMWPTSYFQTTQLIAEHVAYLFEQAEREAEAGNASKYNPDRLRGLVASLEADRVKNNCPNCR